MSKQRIDEMKKFIQLSEALEEAIHKGRQGGKKSIDLSGPDGNAFVLLGIAADLAKQLGWDRARTNALRSEMTSGDYENLLTVFDREFGDYVDLYRGEDDEDDDLSEDFRGTTINPKRTAAQNKATKQRDRDTMQTMKTVAARPPRETGPSDGVIGRMMMDAIGGTVPDGDPFDVLLPTLSKLGIREHEAMFRLNRAARTMGYADYHDAVDSVMDMYNEQNPALQEEGIGNKVAGWFFKKGAETLIKAINKHGKMGPMIVASQVMQKPEKSQRNIIQGAKHYLENVNDNAELRKFVEIMSARENIEESDEGEAEMFYVVIADGSDRCVARLEKYGRSWHEECVFGDSPDGFSSKTYMGYLSPDEIISWLNRDYSTVLGPFANEYDAEMKMDEMAEDEDGADESWMYEGINLTKIVGSVLREAGDLDFDFDDWEASDDPSTNICSSCKGDGCEECDGTGDVFESGDNLITRFEDALEIAYEMAEADPETESTQHLKKALIKAGGNGKDLKAFYEWLDEQGVYTHPSLLETDDDEDDRIIDVGDDEDFEDYSLPYNWNDDNSLDDEYKRGLRFD